MVFRFNLNCGNCCPHVFQVPHFGRPLDIIDVQFVHSYNLFLNIVCYYGEGFFENIKLISILKQIQGIQQCKLFSLPILPIFLDFPFFQIFPDFIFFPDFLFAILFPSHQSRPGQTSRLSLSQEFTSLFNLRHSETDLKSKWLSFHFLIYFHSKVHKVIQKIILVLKNIVIAKKI